MNNHLYDIIVPLDAETMESLYQEIIHYHNKLITCKTLKYMEFKEREYHLLEGLFADINHSLDLLIDMYEDEDIEYNQLVTALELTNKRIASTTDAQTLELMKSFKELIELAIEKHTMVTFYF